MVKTIKTADILSNIERPKIDPKQEDIIAPEKPVPVHPLIASGDIYYQDPRPDLEEDSNLWLQMFIDADKVSKQLVKNLWDMRVWGTRIVKGKGGYILRPEIDPDGVKAWPDKQTYEKWRDKLLIPYKAQIGEILKNLHEWRTD